MTTRRPLTSLLGLAALLGALLLTPSSALAAFSENVWFSFDETKVSYKGYIKQAYLLIDNAGGKTRSARRSR
jgi:hypothetical protein